MAPRLLHARAAWSGAVCAGLSLLLGSALPAQTKDPDRDKDGLSDFQEVHKYRTDPARADSDGDGIQDGDWRERREFQITIRSVVQVMRPVTPDHLCDDYQDARVLDETADHVELEVIHYPYNTVASAIEGNRNWRRDAARMKEWTAPGPTADWTPELRKQLVAALREDGIDVESAGLDDKKLVEQAARWLCQHAKHHDAFTTFVTAFDAQGRPFVPKDLVPALETEPGAMAKLWERDLSARGMFTHGTRGSCTSSAIYLNGCLRALGIPTRIVLCIPVVDANDEQELRMLERGLDHAGLRAQIVPAIAQLKDSWASHTFNEVYVGGRWRRLNYDKLGQDILEPGMFGLMTHVATFSDWADAKTADTIGRRQTLKRYDDLFGGPNPYSTITLRTEVGPHCDLPQAKQPQALTARLTAAHWGDGEDAPKEIRDWFAERKVFGMVVRVEGVADGAALRTFLAMADLRLFLVADGKPRLGVGLDAGCWWFRNDHALVVVPFGPADQRDLATGVPYRLVLRNGSTDAIWQSDDALRVTRK